VVEVIGLDFESVIKFEFEAIVFPTSVLFFETHDENHRPNQEQRVNRIHHSSPIRATAFILKQVTKNPTALRFVETQGRARVSTVGHSVIRRESGAHSSPVQQAVVSC
jgi:hypothetical protein